MYTSMYERAPSQVTKNTNKFIKDYDAQQARLRNKHIHACMHIVEKGVAFSIARNPVVFWKKYTRRPKTSKNWQLTDHQKLFYSVSLYI